MNNSARRPIPEELKKDFLALYNLVKVANPYMTKGQLWEYTYLIQRGQLQADWAEFKKAKGLLNV